MADKHDATVPLPEDIENEIRKRVELAEIEGATVRYDIRRAKGGTSNTGFITVGAIEGGEPPEAHDVGMKIRRAGVYQVIARIRRPLSNGRTERTEIAFPVFTLGDEYERTETAAVPAVVSGPAPAGDGIAAGFAQMEAMLGLFDKLAATTAKLRGESGAGGGAADMNGAMLKTFERMMTLERSFTDRQMERLQQRIEADEDDEPRSRRGDKDEAPDLLKVGGQVLDLFTRAKKAVGEGSAE